MHLPDKATSQYRQRTQNKSEDDGSEGDESEGKASERGESEGDGTSSSTGMDIDLPEPTAEDLTTQISVLHIASKKSNGETHRVTKTAKKRHFDDNGDTDGAAASGSKLRELHITENAMMDMRWSCGCFTDGLQLLGSL
ncbi:hypothetical protein H9L39_09673 [Fusarium oxysporum f. sp. albedinis]|nr:hypothetical protein H9L39_09673 [Fusarium oxysporum f. sp. albedinis]